MKSQMGAVLIFKEGVTQEQVEKLVAKLMERGVLESCHRGPFDPEIGQPVWYIP